MKITIISSPVIWKDRKIPGGDARELPIDGAVHATVFSGSTLVATKYRNLIPDAGRGQYVEKVMEIRSALNKSRKVVVKKTRMVRTRVKAAQESSVRS